MNVLIVSSAKFPEGDAESVRLHAIGKIIRDIGGNVSYLGMGYSEYLKENEFDGFKYTSIRKTYKNKLEKIYFYLNSTNRIIKFLKEKINVEKIDYILCADLPPYSIQALKNVCKQNNINLILDSVEWFSPEQFKLGSLSPGMIMKNIENKYIIDDNINIIAISTYLEKYFSNKGYNCKRIPVILDVKNIKFNKQRLSKKLIILYAGSPGKKDYVKEMLKGILMLDDSEIKNLTFTLAGVSYDDIKIWLTNNELEKIKICINCLGRVNRSTVLKELEKADFTVLLRDCEKRYAKAGFPTKVVESLSTGTPVILNLSSDLGLYIKDNKNGLIVKECDSLEFCNTIKRALKLNDKDLYEMKKLARISAENYFDYRIYKNEIKEILNI